MYEKLYEAICLFYKYWDFSQKVMTNYSAFHKTFDKRFPKFVWNSRSSLRTEQFHYVVVNQIANFETKL